MLAIYEPAVIMCWSCGEESEAYNKAGLCKECYKTAFAIEEVVVKAKVDWSKLGSGAVRAKPIREVVWKEPPTEKIPELVKNKKKKKKDNPDQGRIW